MPDAHRGGVNERLRLALSPRWNRGVTLGRPQPDYDGPALSREVMTDLAMLERLIEPAGKDVLDIGCGGGALVRELEGRGARVVGV